MISHIRTVAIATALLASTGAVSAQDVMDSAIEKLAGGWTGGYAGAFAGTGTFTFDAGFGPTDFSSTSAGVFGGYNFQLPNGVVFGVDADVSKVNGSSGWDFDEDGSAKFAVDWTAHLRSRAGLAVEQALFYVAGGLALTSGTLTVSEGGDEASDSQIHTGLSLGAGVEVAVTPNVLLRAEYLHDAYQPATYVVNGTSGEIDLSSDTVRAGIAVKF